MKFRSTRGLEKGIASANAIINGISKDGGLYVPDEFPKIYEDLKANTSIKYEELAFKVINDFLDDHNYQSYYQRTWKRDDKTTVVDVGSHTEFFYIQEV